MSKKITAVDLDHILTEEDAENARWLTSCGMPKPRREFWDEQEVVGIKPCADFGSQRGPWLEVTLGDRVGVTLKVNDDYFEGLATGKNPVYGVNAAYYAWKKNKQWNTNIFEIDELPWFVKDLDEATHALIETLQKGGVREFIVTDESTGLMRGVIALLKQGCKLVGPGTVNHREPYYEATKQGLLFKF